MAQMTVKLGFKLRWWVRPAIFVAVWSAYPFLAFRGEEAAHRYIHRASRFISHHGLKRCAVTDDNTAYEVTLG